VGVFFFLLPYVAGFFSMWGKAAWRVVRGAREKLDAPLVSYNSRLARHPSSIPHCAKVMTVNKALQAWDIVMGFSGFG